MYGVEDGRLVYLPLEEHVGVDTPGPVLQGESIHLAVCMDLCVWGPQLDVKETYQDLQRVVRGLCSRLYLSPKE